MQITSDSLKFQAILWISTFSLWLSLSGGQDIHSETPPHYLIITPNVIRIDTRHTILIKLLNVPPASIIPVTFVIQDYSNQQNTLFSHIEYLNSDKFEEINFTIWATQIMKEVSNDLNYVPEEGVPNFIGFSKTPIVQLTISSPSIELIFKEKFYIPIDLRVGNLFVLTDKTLYTPSEQVKVRVLNLDEFLKSSTTTIRIDIKNPDGIIVKRLDNLSHTSGIIQAIINLPPNPKLGKWEVLTFKGITNFYSESAQFEVKPFNLPSFTVEIRVSHSVIYPDDAFDFTVRSLHSFGIPIKGSVYVKVGVKTAIMETVKIYYTKTKELMNGEAQFGIERRAFSQPKFPEGHHLYIEAIVTEKSSGTKESKTHAHTRFSVQEFKIDIKSDKSKFKPGLPYILVGKIYRSRDNSSVPYVPLSVSSYFTSKNGTMKRLYKTGRNSTFTSYDGSFHITIGMPGKDVVQSVVINVYTAIVSRKLNHQARVTLILWPPEEGASKTYLQVAPMPDPLFVGDHFRPTFITEETNAIQLKALHYLIICKGQIYQHGKIEGDVKYKLKVNITESMVPTFQIVAYFLDQINPGQIDVIADSAEFRVIRKCEKDVLIYVDGSSNLKPAHETHVLAKGIPGTYLAFLAVDETIIDYNVDYKFSNDKVNQHLSGLNYDCSLEDKTQPEYIFYSAGLSIVSNFGLRLISRKSLECPDAEMIHRQLEGSRKKKRSIMTLSSQFASVLSKSHKQYDCCKLGKVLYKDGIHTDCQTAYENVIAFLPFDEVDRNCASDIIRCCTKSRNANGQRSYKDISQLIPGYELMQKNKWSSRLGMERTYFPHSWLFEIHQLDSKGILAKNVTLPDSITTWILKTLTVSGTVPLCVAEQKSFRTYKPAHLDIRLPNRIIRGEQILLQVTAYNHEAKDLEVSIYMYGVDDLCSEAIPGEKSEKKHVTIKAKDSVQVTFPIIPLHVRSYNLTVEMTMRDSVLDSITKSLKVEPEGVLKIITKTYAIDPQGILNATQNKGRLKRATGVENGFTKSIPIKITEKSIPGTEKCLLQVTGNMMDISIINKELNDNAYRINSPRYSGTNLLAKFALTVFIMDNLDTSKRLTPDLFKEKSEEMEKALSELLEFRKLNGSFSTYINTPSSLWMTALMAKILCKARNYIIIDTEQLTCKAFNWIISTQGRDGSYTDNTLEFIISGDETSQKAWLTAFVLIAMEECQNCSYKADKMDRAKRMAGAFLARHLTDLPHILAPLTYASILHYRKQAKYPNYTASAIQLDKLMKKQATTVETASYSLLTFLNLGMFEEAKPYFHRLNHQINSNLNIPKFEKVIALQALSQFIHNISYTTSMTDIQCDLSVPNHPEFYHSLLINNANALISQSLEAPLGETLSINAHGKGLANLNVEMQYNKPPSDELCQFEIDVSTEELSLHGPLNLTRPENNYESRNNVKSHISKLRMKIKIVVTYLRQNSPSGPVVVDVGLFSGMVPVIETLPIPNSKGFDVDRGSFKVHPDIQHIEITDGSVYFYLEKILGNYPFAIDFLVRREYIVGTIQPVPVRVNSYGNIPEVCTRFYHPSQGSPLLETYCVGSMCTCFERDCAICYGPTGGSPALSEGDLRKKACSLDFAWIVRIIQIDKGEQYKHVIVQVQKILKHGIDKVVIGNNRTMITRSTCNCPIFKLNEDYFLMGSQPSKTSMKFNYILNNKYYVENMLRGEKFSTKSIVRQGYRRLHNFEANYNENNLCQ